MDKTNGMYIIKALRRKWIYYTILADVMISLGITGLLIMVSGKLFNGSYWWAALYFLPVFAIFVFIHRVWLVNEKAIAQLLDRAYPQLEESSSLLLRPLPSLNILEGLQYRNTCQALLSIAAPLHPSKKIRVPVFVLGGMLVVCMLLYKLPFRHSSGLQPVPGIAINHAGKPELILPQVSGVTISIKPPAYTRKKVQRQYVFNLVAEEGALVEWQLKTNTAAGRVEFVLNETLPIALVAAGKNHTEWRTNRKIDSTGFYQVNIDGNISERYKIETIKDQPPVVLIQLPKQYTTIDIGEPRQLKISTSISDDYGIKDAAVVATVASGSGEAVKFKEQKMLFPGFIGGKTEYRLHQSVSLPGLGMQAGDELYFYVQATDSRQQQTRSDIYIVHLPDTAQLMSLEGLGNSLALKPEYFRSQRQIIIETEQLLKERDTINAETFKNRSNNLGLDQKLLRLRYGKFLGDENETGQNDARELEDISNFSDAEKITDAYTDKHDNAEDASFYEPETKKQLRATLTEMWAAEMRLRTFAPQTALPFEYKALRLLKDLQQKSRAYVAKANFKTAPLDLKKRLTGDLSKINPALVQKDSKQQDLQLPLRSALSVLEEIRASGGTRHISPEILKQANLRLHEKAIQQPALYLAAVQAMEKIITAIHLTRPVPVNDIVVAENGLRQLLLIPGPLPSSLKTSPAQVLSKQYFDNLQKQRP